MAPYDPFTEAFDSVAIPYSARFTAKDVAHLRHVKHPADMPSTIDEDDENTCTDGPGWYNHTYDHSKHVPAQAAVNEKEGCGGDFGSKPRRPSFIHPEVGCRESACTICACGHKLRQLSDPSIGDKHHHNPLDMCSMDYCPDTVLPTEERLMAAPHRAHHFPYPHSRLRNNSGPDAIYSKNLKLTENNSSRHVLPLASRPAPGQMPAIREATAAEPDPEAGQFQQEDALASTDSTHQPRFNFWAAQDFD